MWGEERFGNAQQRSRSAGPGPPGASLACRFAELSVAPRICLWSEFQPAAGANIPVECWTLPRSSPEPVEVGRDISETACTNVQPEEQAGAPGKHWMSEVEPSAANRSAAEMAAGKQHLSSNLLIRDKRGRPASPQNGLLVSPPPLTNSPPVVPPAPARLAPPPAAHNCAPPPSTLPATSGLCRADVSPSARATPASSP